jgi:hypothetical protein
MLRFRPDLIEDRDKGSRLWRGRLSGLGPDAGVFQEVSGMMRIIKEHGEMQLAQKRLETSSMAILTVRDTFVPDIWLAESASESPPAPVGLKRCLPGGKSCREPCLSPKSIVCV